MDFRVRFHTEVGYAFEGEGIDHVGLVFYDIAKVKTQITELDPVYIVDTLYSRKVDPVVSVPLKFAEAHRELFMETSVVTVDVPTSYITNYGYYDVDVRKNDKTGEIKIIMPVWKYAGSDIINNWEADGCPLRWGFDDVPEPEETA